MTMPATPRFSVSICFSWASMLCSQSVKIQQGIEVTETLLHCCSFFRWSHCLFFFFKFTIWCLPRMHHSEESDIWITMCWQLCWQVFMLPWLQKHGRVDTETCSVVPAQAWGSWPIRADWDFFWGGWGGPLKRRALKRSVQWDGVSRCWSNEQK